ncbi:Mitochondrial metalloendopeptidase oma1 [Thalictrum thalictroides]|uniref:Mitochondrial metalloendopeptidase oma1 n=1 Tax=Thalictrum thalictroides TaxID=46969 RepID=A0A7J6WPI8_THATH|nr:Mitochondrial metalloendopeptidase oma1 [Thalictrum thalictroides]
MSLYRRTKLAVDLLQKLVSKTINNNTTRKQYTSALSLSNLSAGNKKTTTSFSSAASFDFSLASWIARSKPRFLQQYGSTAWKNYGHVNNGYQAYKFLKPQKDFGENLLRDASRQFKQYSSFSHLFSSSKTPISTSSRYSVRSLFTAPQRNINCLNRFGSGFRGYHVGRNQVRKPRVPRQWFLNKKLKKKIALAVSSGVSICVYYLNRETVPYSKRTRLVILPRKWEKFLGDRAFEHKKKTWEVLPVEHPLSAWVASISKEIIKVANKHVHGVEWNWEVLVVDDPQVNAVCYPGGKIVVYTGLINQFRRKGEVATIIGHEIGHAIARHTAEALTKYIVSAIFQKLVFSKVTDSLIRIFDASDILIHLPFSRKMEKEADYLGLLMMASAGYDPRIAPKVYEKLALLEGDSNSESSSFFDILSAFLSTHPPSMERAKLLTQAQVMEEALTLYEQNSLVSGVYRDRRIADMPQQAFGSIPTLPKGRNSSL